MHNLIPYGSAKTLKTAPLHPITHASLGPPCDDIRHLKPNQEFYRVVGCFGQISKKTLRQTRLLGCERPYLQMAFRGLLIRTGSGTADVMSVAFVAAEVTGDQVALRVASAGKTRVSSGEIWTAKSAFSVGRPSVDFWFGALGNRSVSPCLGPKPHLRSPTFGPEIRNSSSSVRRQFGGNSHDFEPTTESAKNRGVMFKPWRVC